MNILYLCDEYPPGRHGGIGTVVQMLAKAMSAKGHQVTVAGFYDWGYGGEDEFLDGDVKVYRFRRRLSHSLFKRQDSLFGRALFKLCRISGVFQRDIEKSLVKYKIFIEQLIEQYNIDIIEMPDYNDYVRFCNSYVPFPKFSVPVVAKLHGSLTYIGENNNKPIPQYMKDMEHDILLQASSVCSVSKYRAEMANTYHEYDGEIKVMYNGIDTTTIGSYQTINEKRVIFTGTLNENKGISQLAKAWNKVIEEVPDAELIVFGKGPVERVKALMTTQARKTVSFMGHVNRQELFRYLGEASIAIFPSFAESFALAPMEAMACGTAVIYTSRTSGPELVDEGVNGLLVDPGNVADIAEKIIKLLSDKALTDKLAANGKQWVVDSFDMGVVADKHTDYYKQVLAS